jgi:pyruvate dehydrogenase E2 component (dihydrolipoamide acetyltransferase)
MGDQEKGTTSVSVSQFNLPDVGEGLTEAEIVSWRVQRGDEVKVNDIIVEIETAKSLVELPCPFAGVVEDLLVEEGATVPVGTPIISVRTGAAAPADGASETGAAATTKAAPDRATEAGGPATDMVPTPETGGDVESSDAVQPSGDADPENGRQPVLVGYGPRTSSLKRRVRKSPVGPGRPTQGGNGAPSAPAEAPDEGPPVVPGERPRVLAKPPVRKLAKDLGVDISTVTPTGPGGVVTPVAIPAALAARGISIIVPNL